MNRYAIVSAGSTVDSSVVSGLSGNTTVFNANGSVYMTAYTDGSSLKFSDVKYTGGNVAFLGWYSGTTNLSATTAAVSKTYASVDASIESDVYLVVLRAVTGVDNVYLDGVLMTYGQPKDSSGNAYYAYYAYVAAGTHKVTFSLASGYTGEGKLYADGTLQSGLLFKASGDPVVNSDFTFEYVTITLQLSGISLKSEESGGLAITDYLLIVLVALIAALGFAVAARYMRD